jgi:lactosylceramide 4-alpha-galactosyltransferase
MYTLCLYKVKCHFYVLAVIIVCLILSCFLLTSKTSLEKLSQYNTVFDQFEATRISPVNVVTCYDRSFGDDKRLANVLDSKDTLLGGKNIFFHETSCSNNGILKLTARQACAIESAAISNPDWNVFVLFASDMGFRNSSPLPLIDQVLKSSNVQFRSVNVTEYAEGTPLEDWIKERVLFRSKYLIAHFADVLRLLRYVSQCQLFEQLILLFSYFCSLYKFGGTHLDMDVVVMKSFNSLKPNFAGTETTDLIANGVMNFENQGFGHRFTEMCLR